MEQRPSGRGLGFSKGGRLVGGRGLAVRVTSPPPLLQAAAPQPTPHTPVTHTHTCNTPRTNSTELSRGKPWGLTCPFSPEPQPAQPPATGSPFPRPQSPHLGGALGSRLPRDSLTSAIEKVGFTVPWLHPILSVAVGAKWGCTGPRSNGPDTADLAPGGAAEHQVATAPTAGLNVTAGMSRHTLSQTDLQSGERGPAGQALTSNIPPWPGPARRRAQAGAHVPQSIQHAVGGLSDLPCHLRSIPLTVFHGEATSCWWRTTGW